MILYKYLPPERIDVFRSSSIRVTQPCALNDPHDALVAIRSRLEEQNGPDEAVGDDFKVERFHARMFREELSKQIGVLCLTDNPTSTLMWSHYALSHTGFLLHFDSRGSFFDRKLNWRHRQYGVTESTFGNLAAPSEVTYFKTRQIYYTQDGIPWDVLYQKSEDWKYESEFRSLMNLSEGDVLPETRNDRWPVYLFSIPSDSLTGVTVGLATDDTVAKEIRKICASRELECWRIRPDHLNFELHHTLEEKGDMRLSQ